MPRYFGWGLSVKLSMLYIAFWFQKSDNFYSIFLSLSFSPSFILMWVFLAHFSDRDNFQQLQKQQIWSIWRYTCCFNMRRHQQKCQGCLESWWRGQHWRVRREWCLHKWQILPPQQVTTFHRESADCSFWLPASHQCYCHVSGTEKLLHSQLYSRDQTYVNSVLHLDWCMLILNIGFYTREISKYCSFENSLRSSAITIKIHTNAQEEFAHTLIWVYVCEERGGVQAFCPPFKWAIFFMMITFSW